MGKYFGTDGFRGEANVNLTCDHAYAVGRFLGWYLAGQKRGSGEGERARVIIGKDTRRSSYMLEYSLVAGLTASGADAYMLHVTTTPSVAHVVRVDRFDCGIMISASHNPYYDNGIKLIDARGGKMSGDVCKLIEDYIDGNLVLSGEKIARLPFAKRDKIGKTVDYASGRNRYVGYLISLGMYSLGGIKVGLDCANGSSWNIAKAVFDALGATTYVINAEPNGVNINEIAGSTHIEGLRRLVRENGLDVGFAFDGDADRCLCVDENGEVVTGDQILYVCAKDMKERGELASNTVVATVMSNCGLFKALKAEGIDCAQTPVGDRFVHEYMVKHGCELGGEQSGHVIFSKFSTTGDGILTSLKIMESVIGHKSTLSRLCRPLKLYPQKLINIPVTDKKKALSDEGVLAAVSAAEDRLKGEGRVLLRASGTERLVRLMVEAESGKECEYCAGEIFKAVKASGVYCG